MFTRLAADGQRVQCGKCGERLADIEIGPLEGHVAERGGPALGTYVVPEGGRTVRLREGYVPPPEGDDIWRMSQHATRRMIEARRSGLPLPAPRFADGVARNGLVEFPARVLCYRCGTLGVIDETRLRPPAL